MRMQPLQLDRNFAVAICAKDTPSEALTKALEASNVFALNVVSPENWLLNQPGESIDLLWIKADGSFIYAKNNLQKAAIASALMAATR